MSKYTQRYPPNKLNISLPSKDEIFSVSPQLIRSAIIAGVLLLSLISGMIAYKRQIILIPFAFFGLGGVMIFLRRPALGLIFAVFGGALIPFSGPSGLNAAVLGTALMMGVWILRMLVYDRKIQLVSSRTMRPAIIFIVISILAFINGQIHWYPFASQAPIDAQIGGLLIFVLSLGAFIVSAYLFRDLRWLQALTWSFIGLGTVYVVGRFLGFGSIADRFYSNGFIAGSMFWTWLVAMAFSQAFLNNQLSRGKRIALGGIVLITLYVATYLLYDWKSGWIPSLVAVATIIGIRYWRRLWVLLPFSVIPAYYLATNAITSDQISYGTRIDAWIITFQITNANPVLGLGFANYRFYTPLFPFRGLSWIFNSHNQYLDIYAQTGILGIVCLLWLTWELTRLGLTHRERVPDGFSKAYVYGALGGIAGTLVSGFLVDWFLPFVYNIGMNGFRASMLAWIFLGGLVALEQMVQKQEKPPDQN